MKRFSLIGLCLTVVVLVMSGCSDFHVVKPDNPVVVQTETNPLPLTVGIRVANQRITGGFSDMGPSLASRLTNANLFKSVIYPVRPDDKMDIRSEEHTSELQSQSNLVCRLLLEKKKAPAIARSDP